MWSPQRRPHQRLHPVDEGQPASASERAPVCPQVVEAGSYPRPVRWTYLEGASRGTRSPSSTAGSGGDQLQLLHLQDLPVSLLTMHCKRCKNFVMFQFPLTCDFVSFADLDLFKLARLLYVARQQRS